MKVLIEDLANENLANNPLWNFFVEQIKNFESVKKLLETHSIDEINIYEKNLMIGLNSNLLKNQSDEVKIILKKIKKFVLEKCPQAIFELSNEFGESSNFGLNFDKMPFDVFIETIM